MLTTIQSFIESAIKSPAKTAAETSAGFQLAAAALMIEVTAADFVQHPDERTAVYKALRSSFDLSQEDLEQLINDAEQHQQDATSLYEFTSILNAHCTQPEKFEVLVNLWRIAFADGDLDKYEDHRIRRIAELLNLSHREFIQAKLRIQT